MPPDVENRWGLFCTALEKRGLRPPDEPAFLEATKKVFTFSDFVWKNCLIRPNLLFDLFTTKDLQRRYKNHDHKIRLEHLLKPIDRLKSIDREIDLMTILRQFRCREMIRIAWRDLAGRASLSETMSDLTWFSDTIIDLSLALLYQAVECGRSVSSSRAAVEEPVAPSNAEWTNGVLYPVGIRR